MKLLLFFVLPYFTARLVGGRFLGGKLQAQTHRSNVNDSVVEKTVVVSFVNGIYHSLADWNRIANQLKDTFQQEVRPFYNPSSGWWVADAAKTGLVLVSRSNDLMLAKQLAKHLQSCLQEVGPNGRVFHIAHSGGAILTYLAAKHHLSPTETSRIDIVTFGGGRSITHKYFKSRIRNYYSKNDPVLMVEKRASYLFISSDKKFQVSSFGEQDGGVNGSAISAINFTESGSIRGESSDNSSATNNTINGIAGNNSNSSKNTTGTAKKVVTTMTLHNTTLQATVSPPIVSAALTTAMKHNPNSQIVSTNSINYMSTTNYSPNILEIRDPKHNTPFIFLSAHTNNPILDHSMEGPTYGSALIYEARELHARVREMKLKELQRIALKNKKLLRKLRKRVANITGVHNFWGVVVSVNGTINNNNNSNTSTPLSIARLYQTIRAVRKQAANITGVHNFLYTVGSSISTVSSLPQWLQKTDTTSLSTMYHQMRYSATSVTTAIRKRAVNVTGVHHFWDRAGILVSKSEPVQLLTLPQPLLLTSLSPQITQSVYITNPTTPPSSETNTTNNINNTSISTTPAKHFSPPEVIVVERYTTLLSSTVRSIRKLCANITNKHNYFTPSAAAVATAVISANK